MGWKEYVDGQKGNMEDTVCTKYFNLSIGVVPFYLHFVEARHRYNMVLYFMNTGSYNANTNYIICRNWWILHMRGYFRESNFEHTTRGSRRTCDRCFSCSTYPNHTFFKPGSSESHSKKSGWKDYGIWAGRTRETFVAKWSFPVDFVPETICLIVS